MAGRRSKGPRGAAMVRAPLSHHEIYKKLAAEANKPLGEYCAEKLAEAHGLEMPAASEDDGQQQLPIDQDAEQLQQLPIDTDTRQLQHAGAA